MSDAIVREDFPTLKKDNQESYWGTGSDLTIVHDGTNTTVTSATGDLIVDNTLATGSSIFRLGTDTSATDFQVQNNSASALFTVNGAGAVSMSGTLTPGGLALVDSATLALGTGTDVVIQFDGTDFEIDNTGATAKTKIRLGTDTTATSLVVENDSATDLFVVDGAGGVSVPVGDIVYERMTLCVIAVGDVTGGATDGTCDVDVQTLDGANVASVKTGIIYAATANGAGSRALSSTVTFSAATNGAIKTSGNGYCVFETDATGNFTCTVSDSADETVYFSVAAADGGVDTSGQGMWVAECVTDAATWSA